MEQPPTVTATPEALFRDADSLQRDALDLLSKGDIRDAAEKSWGAAVAAANGLIVGRGGELPSTATATYFSIRRLHGQDRAVYRAGLYLAFGTRRLRLHGDCFYTGGCEPTEEIEELIRGTADYIRSARQLTQG